MFVWAILLCVPLSSGGTSCSVNPGNTPYVSQAQCEASLPEMLKQTQAMIAKTASTALPDPYAHIETPHVWLADGKLYMTDISGHLSSIMRCGKVQKSAYDQAQAPPSPPHQEPVEPDSTGTTIYAIFFCMDVSGCQMMNTQMGRLNTLGPLRGTPYYSTRKSCEKDIRAYGGIVERHGRYYVPGSSNMYYVCLSRHVDTWQGQ